MAVKWRCFPLHPEVPKEGMDLTRLFNKSELEIEGWAKGFQKNATQLGLPFGSCKKIFNTRLAQEVGLWAAKQGKGDLFHMAAFKACLAHEENIALDDVLLKLVDSIGLSTEEAEKVIGERLFREAVDRDWELSRDREITAVPTLMMNGKRLTGAHPYERIVSFVKTAR